MVLRLSACMAAALDWTSGFGLDGPRAAEGLERGGRGAERCSGRTPQGCMCLVYWVLVDAPRGFSDWSPYPEYGPPSATTCASLRCSRPPLSRRPYFSGKSPQDTANAGDMDLTPLALITG